MRLMLLRHAKAEKATAGLRDRDRPLARRGQQDATRVGAYLVHHKFFPDRVLVSPARRTRETWERIVPAFSTPPAVAYEEPLYDGGPEAILTLIKESDAAQTLMVIGHNPVLHDLAQLLVASGDLTLRELLNEGLPTAGLVIIGFAGSDWRELHPRGGRLERLVTPESLAVTPISADLPVGKVARPQTPPSASLRRMPGVAQYRCG